MGNVLELNNTSLSSRTAPLPLDRRPLTGLVGRELEATTSKSTLLESTAGYELTTLHLAGPRTIQPTKTEPAANRDSKLIPKARATLPPVGDVLRWVGPGRRHLRPGAARRTQRVPVPIGTTTCAPGELGRLRYPTSTKILPLTPNRTRVLGSRPP